MSGVQRLRELLADKDKFISCPGIYDGFTARIALEEGVDCLYMVSFGSGLKFHHLYLEKLGVRDNFWNSCSHFRRLVQELPCLASAWPTWVSQP